MTKGYYIQLFLVLCLVLLVLYFNTSWYLQQLCSFSWTSSSPCFGTMCCLIINLLLLLNPHILHFFFILQACEFFYASLNSNIQWTPRHNACSKTNSLPCVFLYVSPSILFLKTYFHNVCIYIKKISCVYAAVLCSVAVWEKDVAKEEKTLVNIRKPSQR